MTFMKRTLDGIVSAVPQLGDACSSVMNKVCRNGAIPGSGLKLMRLVNKQLSMAMLGTVQGYTLKLDGRSAGLMVEMALLERTRLSHLRVVVTEDAVGRSANDLQSRHSVS